MNERNNEEFIVENENNDNISEDDISSSDDDSINNGTSTYQSSSIKKSSPLLKSPETILTQRNIQTHTNSKNSRQKFKKLIKESDSNATKYNQIITIVAFVVLIAVICFLLYFLSNNVEEDYLNSKCLLNKAFGPESDECNQYQDLCTTIKTGIEHSVKNHVFISVLFAHSEQKDAAENLASKIANVGSCALNTTHSLILTPKGLQYNTNEIINKFMPEIKKYRSVILKDLLDMNVPALLALHHFCDTHNPIVKPTIYTIIIISDDPVDYRNLKNVTDTVYKLLKKKFIGYMDNNKVMPLITRITDGPILCIPPELNSGTNYVSRNKFIIF